METNNTYINIINFLADLMVFKAYSFDEFLKKLIIVLDGIVKTDSCLIYFFDEDKKALTLCASKKPHEKFVGKISLKKNEGITGWVAEHMEKVILEKEAYKDKRFKNIEDLPEDKYEAFFSVPIIDMNGVIGVINMQNETPYVFEKEHIQLVESIVKIISSAFQNVVSERKINSLQAKLENRKIIEKAKWILIQKENISEKKAYDMIHKEAMKKRKTMKDIAEAILLLYG